MTGDHVYIDGYIVGAGSQIDMCALMESDYIYVNVLVVDYQLQNIDHVIEMAEENYKAIYGEVFGLDRATLVKEVRRLAVENRYPKGTIWMTIYLIAPLKDSVRELYCSKHLVITISNQLLYRGYTNWHSGVNATVVDINIDGRYSSAIFRCTAKQASHCARQGGFDVAICRNSDGVIVGVDEYPLFAIIDRYMVVTPTAAGGVDSVERRLLCELSSQLNFELYQHPMTEKNLKQCEELFYLTPQGVHHISKYDGVQYLDIVARVVAKLLNSSLGL